MKQVLLVSWTGELQKQNMRSSKFLHYEGGELDVEVGVSTVCYRTHIILS